MFLLLACGAWGQSESNLSWSAPCGVRALQGAVVLLDREDLIDRVPMVLPNGADHSVAELLAGASALGLPARAVKFVGSPPAALSGVPMIVPVGKPGRDHFHFVVVMRRRDGTFAGIDYPSMPVTVGIDRLRRSEQWNGLALVIGADVAVPDIERSWLMPLGGLLLATTALAALLEWRRRRPMSGWSSIAPAWLARRRGVTLIELLAALAMIGTLAALLLPAVAEARARSLTAMCQQRVRQLGLALQLYESSHGIHPLHVRRWVPHTPPLQQFSGFTGLLPFLEEADTFEAINFASPQNFGDYPVCAPSNQTAMRRRLAALLCPSDSPSTNDYPGVGYRFNFGADSSGRDGPFDVFRGTRSADAMDGLAHTAAFAERRLGSWAGDYNPRFDMYFVSADGPPLWRQPDEWLAHCPFPYPSALFDTGASKIWLAMSPLFTGYSHVGTPNHDVPDCVRLMGSGLTVGHVAARSWHPGGVVLGLLDGSVRFVSNSIDMNVWRALGSRAGGEPVGAF